MNRKIFSALILLVLVLLTYFFVFEYYASSELEGKAKLESDSIPAELLQPDPTILYGMVVDSFQVQEHAVKRNQSISDILLAYNVSHQTIFQLANVAKNVFDVRKIAPNKKYTVIYQDVDSLPSATALVYEPNPEEYVVFNLKDSINVYVEKRPVEIKEKAISGTIQSSLYEEILKNGGTPELVDLVADMYGWQIDFTKIYPGDQFKVLFTERNIDGKSVGVEEILGAELIHYNNPFLSVAFDQGDGVDYFDEEGKSLRKAFLRYPVKFTRISSRYTAKRFHPVQKRYKAHLGTDYAAPTGTPIYAAGDGVITKALYEKYNGRNVKIRHNATYSTQYLHMNRIAKGISPGSKVKQGQLIGYVGSTGLASGPHLCYRFWKNGRQVDAMKVDLPPSEPIKEDYLSTFNRYKSYIRSKLDQIPYPESEDEVLMAGMQ
ncbi:peptidoglycan DD-metalloendopeptidase family protein [Marivirga harenae]|uniref:peptidoglycan DD-metalloendopeptidase family protein n=1 Tax=Marivirga harenae TaxID=2010992 RepID=UPI0026E0B0D5|nr:peptidoglycan DD-metalloendopeptidase family protein [Marivirga harenae]WKV12853.1 peptidoglycan DD-metalloendopeptidase family protein [Marivirga harenae]|tara:strand:+ start:23174 stop:24475 length:1302 start_codon:yes stop_codon:yes gene_type:complete